MGSDTDNLTEYLSQNAPTGEPQPTAYYDREEDSLMVYFDNAPDYAKRLNRHVMMFLSEETNELVGFQIKGLRRIPFPQIAISG
jgi:hypothetical protein